MKFLAFVISCWHRLRRFLEKKTGSLIFLVSVFFLSSVFCYAHDNVDITRSFTSLVELVKKENDQETSGVKVKRIKRERVFRGNTVKLYGSYLKGLYYASEGDYRSAVKHMNRVKKLDPDSVHVRLKIAAYLISMGKLDQAEKELKQAKKVDPGNIDISLALIFLYSYTQKNEELENEYEEFLKKAHKVKPENIKISEYLAQFYFYKQRTKEAIDVYKVIIENNPDYIEGFFWLGYLYDELGDQTQAIRFWKKGLEIDPDNGPILNSLGYIYAEIGIRLEEAEGMIKKALEQEPENGAYLDSLGWVYFKQDKYDEAEKYLKLAISFLRDPVIYEHLGDFYIKLDKKEEAVKYYQEGVQYFPDYKKLQEKLEKYGQDKILKKQGEPNKKTDN